MNFPVLPLRRQRRIIATDHGARGVSGLEQYLKKGLFLEAQKRSRSAPNPRFSSVGQILSAGLLQGLFFIIYLFF